VRDELAEFFEIPKSQVRVITEFMGGGFGAKFERETSAWWRLRFHAKTGAPVKLMLDRRGAPLCRQPSGRAPCTESWCQRDGTLTALTMSAMAPLHRHRSRTAGQCRTLQSATTSHEE